MSETRGITFCLVEDFTHVAFSCAVEPLRIANLLADADLYRWRLISEDGTRAVCSGGMVTLVDGGLAPVSARELVLVVSGLGVERRITPGLLSWLRRERARGTEIGAICSGAYVLARAGFLEGERAAIHWAFHDSFAEEFPDVDLTASVFAADGRHMTASGGTAAADLMLHLIGRDHGQELATAVADQMVYNAVREGSAEQRVSVQARLGMRNSHVAEAIRLMSDPAEAPITAGEIARKIGISTRQLERLFGRYMNCSPKKYATDLRLHRARNLLLQTEISVTEIALACGFDSASHFSRVYRARFGTSPRAQRARLD